MPSGAAVIRYEGARGVVWYVKFRDASGKQVKERVGCAKEGTTRKDAEALLRRRLTEVEDGYEKPEALSFEAFAERFLEEHVPGRNLKTSTMIDYRSTIANHLVPALGEVELVDLSRRPELVERYASGKLAEGLSPKTIRNHLSLLGRMFRVAKRWRLATANPVEMVDPPRGEGAEPQVLDLAEIARLLGAYRQLEAGEEDESEREWWALARRVVTVAVGTGLRRGEILGIRWGDLSLLDRRLSVRQAYVRGEMTTPKSRTSRRTVELVEDGHVLRAFEEQWKASRYRADDSLVFGHPALGTPLDPSKLSRDYLRPALVAAKVERPFRPWHDLRHTALTHEAAVNPAAYVQMRAGHSNGSITERYVHAAQVAFPGAAERGEARIFGSVPGSGTKSGTKSTSDESPSGAETAATQGVLELPGLDSNQQPSG